MKAVLFSISLLLAFFINAQTPIAYYPFSGNANDIIGNNNGTVNGATLTADRFSNNSRAYSFDGINDFITVGQINFVGNNYTISFWMNAIDNSTDNTIFSAADPSDITRTYVAVEYNTGNIRFLHRNPSGGAGGVEISSAVSPNQWHFITCIKENTTLRIYIDGTLVNSVTDAAVININASPVIEFGRLRDINNNLIRHYKGNLDEMKIFNEALTIQQIQAEYASSAQVQKPGSGNAISFDGADDGIEVTSNAALQFPGDLSVECWVKIAASQNNTVNPDNSVLEKWGGNNAGIGYPFVLRLMRVSHSVAFARYNGISSRGVDGVTIVDDNKWHHLMATKSGSLLSFYIDGVLQGTDTDFSDLSNVNNTQNLNIGTRGPIAVSPNNLTGSIDEIRIWNTGLSQSEVRDRMCHKITAADPLYANLVAYYNFDEGSGNTAFDGTINNNNGALANGPVWVTSGAHIGNTSAHSYTGATSSATLANPVRNDALTATLTAGNAAGIQVYCVTEAPNTTNGQVVLAGNDGYFGVFPINGTGNQYTATYNYTGITGNENTFTLYKRADNATTVWNNASALLNTTANTLTATGQNTEYMVGTLAIGNISLSGALTGEYATLKEAFDAINAGGGSGAVTATVNNNTTETVQALLNETNYTVSVVPSGNRTIEGNLNTAMILLNGADNVIFDGQSLTGANTLTLRNTGTTTASVIKLLDAASNNTVKKCILEGSNSGSTVTQGILVINVTTIGNSVGNIIDSNIIRRAGAGGAGIGIMISGTNTSATSVVSNTQITNNSIENVFITNLNSFGISVQNGCVNTFIKGNSIYNTLPINNTLNGISINAIIVSARSTLLGSGAVIDSNFIGGSAPGCGGSKMVISSPNNNIAFFAIGLSDNTNDQTSSVTRNVIRNIDVEVANPTTGTTNPFVGIFVPFAKLQAFNNNTVGDVTNNSVSLNLKPASTGSIGGFGFLLQTGCATPVANNFVGGINITASALSGSAVSPFFVGMDTRSGSGNNIKNNIIGSATADNISISNSATGVFNFQAISSSAPATVSTVNVDSNTVRNINALHTSLAGIVHSNSTTAATAVTASITGNSITNLRITGAASVANGISYSVSAAVTNLEQTVTVKGNLVNNIIAPLGSGMSIRGIIMSNLSTAVNRAKGRVEDNTITNLVSSDPSTAGITRGISFNNDIVTGDSMVFANNAINNITDASATVLTDPTLSSFGNSSGLTVLMPNSAINGTAIIRDNILHDINATATNNAPVKAHAISVFGNAVIVERNKVYNMQNAATSATASLAPLLLRSRPDDNNVSIWRNNMVAINTNTTAQLAGIRTMDGTVKANIYHNSILMEGSSSTNSYALLKDAATPVIDIKNNILYNATGGTGTAFSLGLLGGTGGYTGNNNYFVSPTPASLAQVDAASHTLSSWQAATGQDAATQEGQSGVNTNAADLFTNKTTADLFVNTANLTEPVKASNKGMALSAMVPFDFLNIVRNTSTPDIGAHEFVFTALPVTLVSFYGSKQNNDAQLQWITANEINIKRYEVERSDDGRNFIAIGSVNPGNTTYSFTDANVFSSRALVYYRLRSVDIDARFTYSPIIKLATKVNALNIFPNPVKDVVTISGLQQKGMLRLFAVDGKLIQQQVVRSQTLTLDLGKLNAGTYVLQYSNNDGVISTQKIIKQ
ncbi:LamG-like jellyroll fold domain-containing protein [Ferruginibacter sp.]